MPNWVENNVCFTAKKKDLLDMLEKISFNDAPLGTLDFNKVIPMPPSLNIEVKFADEDLGVNCGLYELYGGEILEDCDKDGSDEAFEFACEVWGYDPDEMRAEYGYTEEDESNVAESVAEEYKEENENEIPSLTPEMEEYIYRKKQREYRRADAERQLTYYFFGTEDPDDDDLIGFEESHGYSFESLISKSGERYICIDIIVDMFEEAFDCNCAENDTWQAVIQEYFKR